MRGIALGVVLLIATNILPTLVGGPATPLYLAAALFYAVQAHQLEDFEIPAITSFCKQQRRI